MQTRIHKVLAASGGSIVFPGCYDALSAKILQRVGFPMSFISGYSVAASQLGEPDLGLLTQTEITDAARRVCRAVTIPIIVDADTGYGNPLNVIRTVNLLIEAGAAGCFLEDQQWPKKCGHMRGKRVIDRDEYIHKIRAAVEARANRDFFIVARTDSLAVHGIDEAVTRVTLARETGADASFIEAPESLDHLKQIGSRSPHPNVANMIEHGKTPLLSREELVKLGFHLILYPLAGIFSAAKALENIYTKLLKDQTTTGTLDQLMTFKSFNDLIGVEQKYQLAEKFGVKS
jgi:methylisocitrate lyase